MKTTGRSKNVAVVLVVLAALLLSGCNKMPQSLDEYKDLWHASFFLEMPEGFTNIWQTLKSFGIMLATVAFMIKIAFNARRWQWLTGNALQRLLVYAIISFAPALLSLASLVVTPKGLTLDFVQESLGWVFPPTGDLDTQSGLIAVMYTVFIPVVHFVWEAMVILILWQSVLGDSTNSDRPPDLVAPLFVAGGWVFFPPFYYIVVLIMSVVREQLGVIGSTMIGTNTIYWYAVVILQALSYTVPLAYLVARPIISFVFHRKPDGESDGANREPRFTVVPWSPVPFQPVNWKSSTSSETSKKEKEVDLEKETLSEDGADGQAPIDEELKPVDESADATGKGAEAGEGFTASPDEFSSTATLVEPDLPSSDDASVIEMSPVLDDPLADGQYLWTVPTPKVDGVVEIYSTDVNFLPEDLLGGDFNYAEQLANRVSVPTVNAWRISPDDPHLADEAVRQKVLEALNLQLGQRPNWNSHRQDFTTKRILELFRKRVEMKDARPLTPEEIYGGKTCAPVGDEDVPYLDEDLDYEGEYWRSPIGQREIAEEKAAGVGTEFPDAMPALEEA